MSARVLQVHEHTWTPADRAELQIRSLPVDVPRDVEALRIDLDVAANVGSVIDLGAQSPRGYVGWSGGARRQIVISAEWSTPGYLPTRGYAGTWQVLLGLHRVPADGARTTVTVSESNAGEVARLRALEPADPPVPLRPPRRTLPSSSGLTWLAADFHTHTVHSDGSLSVGGLAALAVSRGLDVLAITDHNTTSHHAELPAAATRYGIQLVPGQEITRDTGHANAFGDIGFVDFRTPPATWAAEVASRGGVFSISHPLAGDCAWLVDGLVAGSRDASGTGSGDGPARPLAEVWHSSWEIDRTWGAPLSWWSARPETVPIGGSDFHLVGSDDLPGAPTTWVLCDGDDVLGALRSGRTAVSAGREGPLLLREGDEVVCFNADGLLLTGPGQPRRLIHGDLVTIRCEPGPWWLEDGRRVVHALTH